MTQTLIQAAAVLLLAGGLLSAAGCADSARRGPGEAGAVLSDSWITARVKSELASDKDVSAKRVRIKTVDGVVTLSGAAKSLQEVDRAVERANEVEGVRAVVDNIDVIP